MTNLESINTASLTDLKEKLGLIKKLSKRYNKYANIAAKGFVTKQEIVNLKSILSGHGLVGNLTKEEIDKLTDIHEYGGKPTQIIKIEAEHTGQGLNFLKGLYKTPGGKLKKQCRLDSLEVPDGPCDNKTMIKIIEDFKEFRYAGFMGTHIGSLQTTYSPVWEVVSNAGHSFTYVQQFSGFWRR